MATTDNTKIALYRKYRPTKLSEVIGQPQVTDVLDIAAKKHSFAHAYLFTGQRGTGKTTVARILAHLINEIPYDDNLEDNSVDIIEIDAASNNGVDDVRQIRDSVNLAPMSASHKVYIIDEFHMLSKPAFNALLKTIEEPPEFVVFILATTELNKVPATILSRVQRFHFRPVSAELLSKHLGKIAKAEKINVDGDALLAIANAGGGSVRDSVTLLDQLSGSSHITLQVVNDVLGLTSQADIDSIINATINGDSAVIISHVEQIIRNGNTPASLAKQLIKSLQQRAVEQPRLYTLVNQLLDVEKSSLPDAKLLAVLVSFNLSKAPQIITQPTAKAASVSTNAQTIATAKQVIKNDVVQKPAKVASSAKTTSTSQLDKDIAAIIGDSKKSDAIKATAKPKSAAKAAKTTSKSATADNALDSASEASDASDSIKDFQWNDILQQLADQDRPSTRSLLDQADYRYDPDNNTLTLFFGRPFYRKRAKTKLFLDTMSKTFQEVYQVVPAIVISDEEAPADSAVAQALKVVGGEVINLKDGTI